MEQFISFALGAGLVLIIVSTVIIIKALLKVNEMYKNIDNNHNEVQQCIQNVKSDLETLISESDRTHYDNNDRVYSHIDSRIDKLIDQLDRPTKTNSKQLLKG